MVLPRFGGRYELNPLPHQNKNFFFKLFFSSPSTLSPSHHQALLQKWRWKWGTDHEPGIWTFDVAPSTLSIVSSPKEPQGCVDLLKQALFACSTSPQEALLAAHQALEQLELLPSNAISSEEMEKLFYDIRQLPKQARLFEKSASPALLSLLLKTGLKMRDRASPAIKAKWNKQMAIWIPLYFKMGRKMSEEALLSPKEELLCLMLMEEHNAPWFQKHGPLLATLHPHGSSEPFKGIFPSRSTMHSIRRGASSTKFDTLALRRVIDESLPIIKDTQDRSFTELYQIAKTGKREDLTPVLAKLQQKLQSMDEVEMLATHHANVTYSTRAQYSGSCHVISRADELGVTRYLETIFACRIQDPDLELPELPPSSGYLMDFVESLQQALETSASRLAQAAQPPSHLPADLGETFAHVSFPIEGISRIEVLEELTTKQQKSLPLEGIALQAQADSALLTEEEQNAAFTTSPFAYAFTSLKLKELPKDAAVQKTKEKLEGEIASLRAKTAEVHAITKEGAEKVLDSVKKTATDLATKAEQARATIDETLKKADPKELTSLRELAGQVSRLSWAECLEAYLQNDFSALQAKTKNRVDIDSLKEQMKAFFLLETRRRHAELAIREISEFLQVPSLQKSASAQERLHEILSRPRYFDPNTYPQLLVMEYCLGFFLKEEQLQMGIDFVQNPNCIRQAVTGAGKTSAILPFVGLMKANGHNLVTLKFLDPLFSANLAAVQKLLGALKKKAVPLLFSADTPLVIQKSIGERVEQESVFKEMYETAQKVILQKGCLITNKKTQPLLKAKLIELYEKLTPLPPEDRSPMDIQHLLYLGKLLALFKEREETLYDEFDKFLSPKEELHLRVEAGNPIPQFLSDTALEMFDLLLANKTLALRENGQDHLSAEQQKTILTDTATALAREKWSELDEGLLTSYFQGTISEKDENILVAALEKLPPIDRDRIALQKDLLKILSTTLFKAADKDYARSKRDGESVIPCAYADTPKEGSEYDDVRVRLCYLIQYVYQKGVGFDSFAKWEKELKETVEKDLANGIKLEETVGEKLFKSYFPEESLDTLNPDKLKRLHERLAQDPALLRRFLSVMTQKLRMPGTRISLNPHNQVSIAHSSSGTSATLGCLEGMHRNFDTADLSSSTAQGKMIHRLLKRVGKGKTIQYNPTKPGEIVPSLLAQEKGAKVLIDGAGALRGVAGDVSARQLQQGQEGLKAVAYFDLAGDIQFVGSGSLEETGCIYSHAQARGADRTLPVDHRAVLIVNGKTPQEEVSQNEGRLRKEDQPLTLAVPTGSPIQDVGDLVNAGLTQQAKAQAELLFLSKQQELQDIVHSAMVDHLVDCSAQGAIDKGFALYTKYQKAGLLVSTHRENWEESGSYFTQHNRIERAAPPLQVLQKSKKHYSSVAKECGLDGVPEKLTDAYKKIKKLQDLLPETVSSALETDKEAQVEVETEIEVSIETETELDVATEKPGQPTYYLPWNWKGVGLFHHDYYYKQFSAFDHHMLLSPNFAPLGRNALAPPIHQRHWHDPKQSRLRYVEFERVKSSYSDGSWTNATALDQLDFEETLKEPKKGVDIYDTVLHRYIIGGADLSEDDLNLRNRQIAQMRFADGQCSGYTEKEWDALTKWIQEQDNPKVLETYFLEQVLKYRPKEGERYQFSPLANLFRSKPTS